MKVTRRQVLQGLAATAAVACSRRTGGRTLGGSLGGASHTRGHRLREAAAATPARWEDVPVVVIGAGIAGLSAAWTLERAGQGDFVLVELEDAAGGTARSGRG